jgi:phosphomevalonate kinase
VANVRERLAKSKQTTNIFHMEMTLNEVEDKEQFHIKIRNRLAALENLDAEVNNNIAWERITENIKKVQRKKVIIQ